MQVQPDCLIIVFILISRPCQLLGDTAEMDKLNRRLVKVNKSHTDECKKLLTLMGIPFVEVVFNLRHGNISFLLISNQLSIGRPHVKLKPSVQH